MKNMKDKLDPGYYYLDTVSTDYGHAGPAGIKQYKGTCTELIVNIPDVPECVLEKIRVKYDEYVMDPKNLESLKEQGKSFITVCNQDGFRLIVDKFCATEWLGHIIQELKPIGQ